MQRVEVAHESLLTTWPRLVRWQAQETDAAQLRDQLRQAGALWEDRGRKADLLWSGGSQLELAAWLERYPGSLTATERPLRTPSCLTRDAAGADGKPSWVFRWSS